MLPARDFAWEFPVREVTLMSVSASLPRLTRVRGSRRMMVGSVAALLAVVAGIVLYLVLSANAGDGDTDGRQPSSGPGSRFEECLNTTGRLYC
jgi:hypothetical protein